MRENVDPARRTYDLRTSKQRSDWLWSVLVQCLAPLLLGVFPAVATADEWTQSKPISQLNFDGTTGNKTIYFETPLEAGQQPDVQMPGT